MTRKYRGMTEKQRIWYEEDLEELGHSDPTPLQQVGGRLHHKTGKPHIWTFVQFCLARLYDLPVTDNGDGSARWDECPWCQEGERPLVTLPHNPPHKDKWKCHNCKQWGDAWDVVLAFYAHRVGGDKDYRLIRQLYRGEDKKRKELFCELAGGQVLLAVWTTDRAWHWAVCTDKGWICSAPQHTSFDHTFYDLFKQAILYFEQLGELDLWTEALQAARWKMPSNSQIKTESACL